MGLGRVCETSRLFIKYVCCRKRSTLLLLIFSPVQFYFHSIETLDFFRCSCCFPSTLLLFGGVALFFHFVIFTTLASKSLEVNSNRYQFSIETSLHAKSVWSHYYTCINVYKYSLKAIGWRFKVCCFTHFSLKATNQIWIKIISHGSRKTHK